MPIVYPPRYYKPAPSPVLDVVGTAAAAYGLRKMRAAYAGYCLRVRRSSDDAELDIGFDSITGALDTAALLAHTGASSGYVVTWYDQSGNGVNATQSTQANQPRIVNSGVVDTSGNQPGIVFDGSTGFFNVPGHPIKNAPGVTCMAVTRPNTVSSIRTLFHASKNTSTALDRFLVSHRAQGTDGGWLARDDADVAAGYGDAYIGPYWSGGEAQLMCTTWDATAGTVKIHRNQIEKITSSRGTTGTIDADPSLSTLIGKGISGSDGTNYYSGTIYSLIIYLRALTDVERRDASQGIIRTYGAKHIVIYTGDSILASTVGTFAESERLHSRTKANAAHPEYYDTRNLAWSGSTIADIMAANPSTLFTHRHIPLPQATIVYGTGRNDMSSGLTPAQTLVQLQTYYQSLKTNGYSRIVYCTPIADGTQSIYDNNRALRDLVLAGPSPPVADAICDWGSLPEFDEKADADNLTYYQPDKVHPNVAGTDKLAAKLATVI